MGLSERLRILRKDRNITADELAERLGLNTATYRHYEVSGREPRLQTLVMLAAFFDVSVDYLLGRTDNPAPSETARGTAVFHWGEPIKILREKKGLTPKMVAAALGVLERSYAYYERGEHQPKFPVLIMLADYYGVSVDTVLGRGLESPRPVLPLLSSIDPAKPFHEILQDCMDKRSVKPKRMISYLGINAEVFSRYLSGKKKPDVWLLIRLGDFFGVSVDYLIGRTPEKRFSDPRRSGDLKEKDREEIR